MTANASSLETRILIGDDQQDWTSHLELLTIGYSKRDRQGIIFIEGSVTIADTISTLPPESLSARKNPNRWKRGNKILIQVRKQNGDWVTHPLGWLYILKEPLPPNPDNPRIEIQVGCILRLKDYKQPDDDKSGVTLGEATNRGTIIQNLLNAAGITFSGTIDDYPLETPLPKQDGGSFVVQAGEIAYGALKALYQRNDGTIGICDVRAYPSTPRFVVSVGGHFDGEEVLAIEAIETTDESLYEPIAGDETPVDKMKAVGTAKKAQEIQNFTRTETFEYASGAALGINGIIIARHLKTIETFTQYIKTVQEEIYVCKGLANSAEFPGDAGLVLDTKSTEYSYYETNESNKLFKQRKESLRWFPAVASSYYSAQTPANKNALKTAYGTETVTTTYNYNDKEIPFKKKVVNQIPIAAIVPDEGVILNAGAASDSQVQVDEWTNLGSENYYKQRTIIQQASGQAFENQTFAPGTTTTARINAKLALVTTSDSTVTSNAGQANPPSPERGQPNLVEKEEQLEGEAEFDTAGTSEQPRERTININYVTSKEQLDKIAATEGTILIGKRLGQRFQIPFIETLYNHPEPLIQLVAIEPDGETLQYIADGIEYSHTPTKAIIGFDGIWIATLPASNNSPQPYAISSLQSTYNGIVSDVVDDVVLPGKQYRSIKVRGGLAVGGTVEVLEYDTTIPINLTVSGGLTVGGTVVGAYITNDALTLDNTQTITVDVVQDYSDNSVNIDSNRAIAVDLNQVYSESLSLSSSRTIDQLSEVASVINVSVDLTSSRTITETSLQNAQLSVSLPRTNTTTQTGNIRVIPSLTLSSNRGASTNYATTYETETNTLLAALVGTYSNADKDAINAYIKGLKDDGLWSTIDLLYIMAAPTESDAYINWKNPGTFNGTKNGTGGFTANSGFLSASGRYINTNYTPSTNAVNNTTNSATYGSWSLTNVANGAYVEFGTLSTSGGTRYALLQTRDGSDDLYYWVNEDGVSVISGVTNSSGLFTIVRTSSTSTTVYRNGSSIGTGSGTSTGLPTRPIFIGGYNNNGTQSAPTDRVLCVKVVAGSWNSTQNSNFYSRTQTLLTYRGTI